MKIRCLMGCPKLGYNLSAEPRLRCVYNATEREESHVVTRSDTITHFYYIAGGDGLCGIYVKQTKGATTLKNGMYYVHPDHLGSLAIITDASGNIVQQCTFDAWGVRTFVIPKILLWYSTEDLQDTSISTSFRWSI